MRGTVDGAGVELAYEERGSGPAVLLVHDLGADRGALAPTVAALADRARVIAYDRRGYGASGAPEPYVATTVQEQAQDAAALLDALGVEDAIVAGDGFGALVALDLALRHGARVRGAVLARPLTYALVPEATAALSERRAALEEHLRAGERERAVAAWLDAAGRPAGDAVAWRAFLADLGGLATLPLSRAALRALAVPVVVLGGGLPLEAAAADALARLLPTARRQPGDDLAGAVTGLLDGLHGAG